MFKTNIRYKLSRLWIKIKSLWIKVKSPFRSVVYHIKRYFEIKYWYWWRDTTPLWYNDDTKKWEKSSSKATAKDTIRSWWDAESDILDMMLLKIDHMFYKIKKDGNHVWQYLDAYVFNQDYATSSDRDWALKKSLKSLLDPKFVKDGHEVKVTKNKDCISLSRWIGNIDEFDGHKLDKLESKLSVGKPISEKEQTELEELRELKKNARSESGMIHYYLVHIIPNKKSKVKESYVIKEVVDKQIPYKNPKSAQYYTFDEKKDSIFDDMFLPLPDYKTKERKVVFSFNNFESLSKVDQLIKENLNIDLDVESNFLLSEQSFEVKNSDFLLLSPKVREQVRGRRKDLINILQVRRAVKKIREHNDYEDKYNTWLNKEFETEKEKQEELERCINLYKEDRKKLYYRLADILAEYGETFWD